MRAMFDALPRHELHAVADRQDREARREKALGKAGRPRVGDALRSAGKHHACSLVAVDDGHTAAPVAAQVVDVAVADCACRNLDLDFTNLRRLQRNIFNHQRCAKFIADSGFHSSISIHGLWVV